MKEKGNFEKFERRLGLVDEELRASALEYAAEIFAEEECTREEALKKGLSKAELDKRNF